MPVDHQPPRGHEPAPVADSPRRCWPPWRPGVCGGGSGRCQAVATALQPDPDLHPGGKIGRGLARSIQAAPTCPPPFYTNAVAARIPANLVALLENPARTNEA